MDQISIFINSTRLALETVDDPVKDIPLYFSCLLVNGLASRIGRIAGSSVGKYACLSVLIQGIDATLLQVVTIVRHGGQSVELRASCKRHYSAQSLRRGFGTAGGVVKERGRRRSRSNTKILELYKRTSIVGVGRR